MKVKCEIPEITLDVNGEPLYVESDNAGTNKSVTLHFKGVKIEVEAAALIKAIECCIKQ